MILERLYYVPMGWWRWAKVRMTLCAYRLSGGFRRRIGLNQHFQVASSQQELLRLKPKLKAQFQAEELELARQACPVDAIRGQAKIWKVDLLRCHSCHLCIKLAPESLELVTPQEDMIRRF
jgi:ferredoxin